jgi:uncharacterized membrane protein
MKNKISSLIVISLIILISLVTNVLAINNDFNSCPMGAISGGYGTGAMFLSWIFSILIMLLILAGIYWLIKSSNKTNRREK